MFYFCNVNISFVMDFELVLGGGILYSSELHIGIYFDFVPDTESDNKTLWNTVVKVLSNDM